MDNYINLKFPYYKLCYKLTRKNIKLILKKFKSNILFDKPNFLNNIVLKKYNNNYFIIIDKWNDNIELNSLTDYFTESYRILCKFGNYISPIDYWQQNKKHILKKTLNKYGEITIFNIREIIFNETKLCNNFRISVCLTILCYFKPKTWLDISAGWGDRLISAILYKVELYCGVDPNLDLHKGYDAIINKLVKENKRDKFFLIKDGFETAKLPDIQFDIVFSSPPFFDLEKYSTNIKDSIIQFNTEKDWCDKFLMVSIYKAISKLKIGGHLVLYFFTSEYTMNKLQEIHNIMKYLGIIYFYDTAPRGMYVWQKI
jgi:hypothetical protein